jgi:nucleoid DNA-binding protein
MADLLPDIYSYIQSVISPVTKEGLEDIILKVTAHTNLTKEEAQIIVPLFFEEIRNSMLANEMVIIRRLGMFYISNPIDNNNKVRVFPKFKASKALVKKLNE